MIKIKTQMNPKMLENFQHETFADISIITASTKLNLIMAYLAIDSAFFSALEPDVIEVDLSALPEQALMQVLRSLYGDQLIACSVQELKEMYRVIKELEIDDYKESIKQQIANNKELMENLEILEFCFQNELLLHELKAFHFENNLRALEESRNFLQLNKISLTTLIPILLEFSVFENSQASNSIINNIMENYFNRNNIRAADFFEDNDVEPLQIIWEQFHHTLQIYDRKPIKTKSSDSLYNPHEESNAFAPKRSSLTLQQTKKDEKLLDEKKQRIFALEKEIENRNKLIEKLNKELQEIKKSKNVGGSSRRIASTTFLPAEDEEMSILEGVKNSKKELAIKNFRQSDTLNEPAFEKSPRDPKAHKLPRISRP